MPCYMCKAKIGTFQRLDPTRLRFIRKAQPNFKDDSYLCKKCFAQFERIYKSKNKSKSRIDSSSSKTSITNSSIRTVSSSSNITAIQRQDGNNNSSAELHFDSRSLDSPNSDDTTDRIVQMAPDFLSLRDSTRKTARNAVLNVARQGAEAAVGSAFKRRKTFRPDDTAAAISVAVHSSSGEKSNVSENPSEGSVIHFNSRSNASPSSDDTTDRIVQMVPDILSLRDSTRKTARNADLTVARQGADAAVQINRGQGSVNTSPSTPIAVTRNRLEVVDEETSEDEDMAPGLSPNNLAHVRPVVRRRKKPVVTQYDEIMDLYIARTSGG